LGETHQEDEEDAEIQRHPVIRTEIGRLNCRFADETDQDAGEAYQHEPASAESFDEKGAENVSRKRRQNPKRTQEQGPKARHPERNVQDDSVIGNTVCG
jgi:hypothetical protein